jgi:hypothetical protein
MIARPTYTDGSSFVTTTEPKMPLKDRLFGGSALETRSSWPSLADYRGAFVRLRRVKAYTLAVVASIAIGLGSNIAVFVLVRAAILHPLTFPRANDLLTARKPGDNSQASSLMSGALVNAWAESPLLEGVAGIVPASATVSTPRGPVAASGAWATTNLLQILRVAPSLGRWISPADEQRGAERVVVLSDDLWRRDFAGRPIVGQTITLDGVETRVIARQKPLVPLGAIQAQLVEQATALRWPAALQVVTLHDRLCADTHEGLVLVFLASCLILLVAAANVANLTLTRSHERRHEFAIRLSLGGTTSALRRDVHCEVTVLCCVGGTLAVLMAWALSASLFGTAPANLRYHHLGIGVPEVAVALALVSLGGFIAARGPCRRNQSSPRHRSPLHRASDQLITICS